MRTIGFGGLVLGNVALASIAVVCFAVPGASAASAVQKECSTKYQAAKAANQLNGQSYNQFYKACAAEAKNGATPAAPAVATGATTPPTTAVAPAAPPTAAEANGAVMPTAISASFAKETPHLARLHTCAEQWKLNKEKNATGGLKWPKYYSECNARLKG